MSIPLAVVAAVTLLAACSPSGTSAAAAQPSTSSTSVAVRPAPRPHDDEGARADPARPSAGRGHAALGSADGELPDDVSVFDNHYPAVTKLDPALLAALRRAAVDAGRIRFYVNSGWRSERYQEQLFEQAVRTYGSAAKAARWVARPGTSVHEAGAAVDVGPAAAAAWLSRHGAGYGLCQVYRNERWHYELRPGAADRGCPAMYRDPTDDPRLR